ncbi:thiamine pyrophosphate-dependent dehydrogenase E1 component subunit alpha [Terasakiella pusilla]|uniref:thiamine pyrophosphate-dependent dehydrogenase E1 component subunit alpha n=1 Tax=Terasakiella pusilla TaxID=64973 RepID=UPI003AA93A36
MLSPDIQKSLLKNMLLIRVSEDAIADHYKEWEMRCPVHLCIGQEAAEVGATLALKSSDKTISGHRSHGHYLGKGGDLKKMIAEIYGKATGCAGGKGGSMHLIDLEAGFLGAAPIVGSTIPIGVGAAFKSKLSGEDDVTMVFFGDGACEAGVFHESLNFVKLKNLPVVFVCENNLYSVYSPMEVRQSADRTITDIVKGHGIEAHQLDGNDVELVYSQTLDAVAKARAGQGPVFLELMTYRWREHCGPNFDNHIGYRTEEEYQDWLVRDPVALYKKHLVETDVLSVDEITQMESEIKASVAEAILFAKQSDFPAPETACGPVYKG